MVIITKYDIGDIVICGPIHSATIIGIKFYSGITYDINYWDDTKTMQYATHEWELQLVEKGIK